MHSAGQITDGDEAESERRARTLRYPTRRPASGRRRRSANTHHVWGGNRASTRKHRQAVIIVVGNLPDYGEPSAGSTFSSSVVARLLPGSGRRSCSATPPDN